ncbi:MAG: hypothetical protein RR528_06705 [Angelakisella sp.]
MLDGSVPMALGDSLLLSGIGILVVFMELALLAVMIVIISKVVRGMTEKKAAPVAATPAPVPAPVVMAPAPVAAPVAAAVAPAGALTLTDVDEPTAATAMAVISHKTGIPLNHLAFHSIKGVVKLEGIEERDAAVVMALTAHKLGKPINKLVFKSIKSI